jgi:hypothetical protein
MTRSSVSSPTRRQRARLRRKTTRAPLRQRPPIVRQYALPRAMLRPTTASGISCMTSTSTQRRKPSIGKPSAWPRAWRPSISPTAMRCTPYSDITSQRLLIVRQYDLPRATLKRTTASGMPCTTSTSTQRRKSPTGKPSVWTRSLHGHTAISERHCPAAEVRRGGTCLPGSYPRGSARGDFPHRPGRCIASTGTVTEGRTNTHLLAEQPLGSARGRTP